MKTLFTLFSILLMLATFPTTANDEQPSNKRMEAQQQLLSLNVATVEQLAELKGIGPQKAQAIIEYREAVGPFHHLDQLTEVKGIGQKLAAKLKPQLTL